MMKLERLAAPGPSSASSSPSHPSKHRLHGPGHPRRLRFRGETVPNELLPYIAPLG